MSRAYLPILLTAVAATGFAACGTAPGDSPAQISPAGDDAASSPRTDASGGSDASSGGDATGRGAVAGPVGAGGAAGCPMLVVVGGPTSPWARVDVPGHLAYATLPKGERLLDFSSAGYMGGGVAIPTVAVEQSVKPSGGSDDTAAIQAAIDAVSKLPATGGARGAVLLAPGTFHLQGSLSITTSGVVLRGSGSGSGGTVLQIAGAPRTVITVAGTGAGRSRPRGPTSPTTTCPPERPPSTSRRPPASPRDGGARRSAGHGRVDPLHGHGHPGAQRRAPDLALRRHGHPHRPHHRCGAGQHRHPRGAPGGHPRPLDVG